MKGEDGEGSHRFRSWGLSITSPEDGSIIFQAASGMRNISQLGQTHGRKVAKSHDEKWNPEKRRRNEGEEKSKTEEWKKGKKETENRERVGNGVRREDIQEGGKIEHLGDKRKICLKSE